jgi:D-sedoheptulose 7-phosphate isomerase
MEIKQSILNSIEVKTALLNDSAFLEKISLAATKCTEAFKNQGRLLLCGNGGSASDAQHIAAELSGRFAFDRPPLDAEALHVNTSYLTAVANDYSYDEIYARLIHAKGREGDVLFAFSTSGNSPNIIRAMQAAKEKEMYIVGFTGFPGGNMKALCDLLLNVPSTETPRIQETHILIGHLICELIENAMFKK